jgi:sulfoxide reductase heme-binding subunit YedZ
VKKAGKLVLFCAALVPAALLVRGLLTGNLGVNPAETIQLETGRWTFKFLLLTLAVTPLRRITGWNPIIQYRRMLGLFAFFYGTLHFSAYWAFDLLFSFGNMAADVVKRPFILFGFTAFILMLPLAVTSTKGWIRRLGRRWTTLHALIYVSAILAAVHFAYKVKVFTGDPVYYAAVVALLLGFRVVWAFTHRRTAYAPPARIRPST